MLVNVKINNMQFQEDSSLTILQVAKKHGIRIPNLCYMMKEEVDLEHKPASCRVCVVEVKGRRNLLPACATNIAEGMEIFTHSERVRRERRTIVELLLSDHPHDCLTCGKCGNCELQDLSVELGIKKIYITGPMSQENADVDEMSLRRNASKCILCGKCIAVCDHVQSVGAISATNRGFGTKISLPHDCVSCGQCVQVCPTGALLQVDDTRTLEKTLADPTKYAIVNTAPAVRVALGEEFGMAPGTNVTGKMITALRMMGFKKVFDTNFAADLTIMEETTEFVNRLKKGENLPLITSCCPGWITFVETQYPELLHLPSTCKSPQEMFGAIAKTYFAQKEGIDPKDIVVASLMPCIAKKQELKREEGMFDGMHGTDFAMSAKCFAKLMRRCGIDNLANLPDGQFDDPLGSSTGAADIFGNSGGVMEAVVRTASMWMTGQVPKSIEYHGVFGAKNTREAYVTLGDDINLHLCVVSGLANARKVLEDVKAGKVHYDAIEVMACPDGCINGGGQPVNKHYEQKDVIAMRKEGLRNIDRNKAVRVSCENAGIKQLYAEFLGEPNSELAHKLLHTHYSNKQQTFEDEE